MQRGLNFGGHEYYAHASGFLMDGNIVTSGMFVGFYLFEHVHEGVFVSVSGVACVVVCVCHVIVKKNS